MMAPMPSSVRLVALRARLSVASCDSPVASAWRRAMLFFDHRPMGFSAGGLRRKTRAKSRGPEGLSIEVRLNGKEEGIQNSEFRIQTNRRGAIHWLPVVVPEFCILYSEFCPLCRSIEMSQGVVRSLPGDLHIVRVRFTQPRGRDANEVRRAPQLI